MSAGHTHLTKDQVFELNKKHGWFQSGDAQSGVSMTFAQDAIEAYERIRTAAPKLLAALEHALAWNDDAQPEPAWVSEARAVIAKATGSAA